MGDRVGAHCDAPRDRCHVGWAVPTNHSLGMIEEKRVSEGYPQTPGSILLHLSCHHRRSGNPYVGRIEQSEIRHRCHVGWAVPTTAVSASSFQPPVPHSWGHRKMELRDTLRLPAKGLRPSAHPHRTLQAGDTPKPPAGTSPSHPLLSFPRRRESGLMILAPTGLVVPGRRPRLSTPGPPESAGSAGQWRCPSL
jgi:hypothetical protein